jgi:ABC-type Fe3+/spermidine/putrescine transport system ATPase subunit
MGPSGCVKSTLAKLLLGFRQPTDGRISIDGCDIRHMSAAATVDSLKGHVTIVFITHQVPKGLKVDDMIRFSSTESRQNATGNTSIQRSVEWLDSY